MKKYYFHLLLLAASMTVACNSAFVAKPKGYFKINLPAHSYQTFNQPGYPYTFEYPTYAKIVKDSTFFEDKSENPWWINIDFPALNSRIYISYKSLAGNDLSKMIADAYNLTYKHSVKASAIDDSVFVTPRQINGTLFKVGGNAATASQFYLTDSIHHFLRGALYFDAPPNEDSLLPANDFLRQDMLHLINTFEWRK